MNEARTIQAAMQRLSSLAQAECLYDPLGDIFGDGPIHYLVEVGCHFFVAWKANDTGAMIVNPVTRFDLGSLEELGLDEAWTVLRVPDALTDGIHFREISIAELADVYHKMTGTIDLDVYTS